MRQDAGAGWWLEPREITETPEEVQLKMRVPEAAKVGVILLFGLGLGLSRVDPFRIARVSTRLALRKLWPRLVTPPSVGDRWLAVEWLKHDRGLRKLGFEDFRA